jgi:predicted aminopeptidase
MDILKQLRLLTILFFSTACSHGTYLWHQSIGQLQLQWGSRPNQIYLEDPEFSDEHKRKIELVQNYKDYFENYWQRETKGIYTRTTILDRPWVTMLVIASPHDKIEAHQECFWPMGCFPYLGFFNEGHAESYQEKLQKKDLVTYKRPVYAYSTLGYLEDRILSSFFHFNERELAELIFHELYHTIFFVKDQVDLNENLANYFGQQMVIEFFKDSLELQEQIKSYEDQQKQLAEKIVELTLQLNEKYQELINPSPFESQAVLQLYMDQTFLPEVKSLCQELHITNCWPLEREWNNASLAAFLTYEKEVDKIALLHQSLGTADLRKLQLYIEEKYEQYRKESPKNKTFEDILFQGLH